MQTLGPMGRVQARHQGLASALAGSALLVSLAVATSAPVAATTLDSLRAPFVYPPNPCGSDTVTLMVQGFESTPCEFFGGAWLDPNLGVVVRKVVRRDIACFAAPFSFYSVPVVLGRFAPGSHSIAIREETILVGSDGSADTTSFTSFFTFQVSGVCREDRAIPAEQLPLVVDISTDPPVLCPGVPTTLVMRFALTSGCQHVAVEPVVDPSRVSLTVYGVHLGPEWVCGAIVPDPIARVPLGVLPAGTHETDIRLTVAGSPPPQVPPIPTLTYRGQHSFPVAFTCDSTGPLPFVDAIHVLPQKSCGLVASICPDDSIVVLFQGTFPNDCFKLSRIELLPSPMLGPMPQPPIVRVVVDDMGCVDMVCREGSFPWKASVTLPPLPARDYSLFVHLAIEICGNPSRLPEHSTIVPFTVVPEQYCVRPNCNCLTPGWVHPRPSDECDDWVTFGSPAELTFQVQSPKALAGLQGGFSILEPGLRITKLEAIGPAAGMRLTWTPTPRGARFVMFAERGAPIPATPFGSAVSVLRLTLEADTVALPALYPAPSRYRVVPDEILGSDISGNGVPTCLPPPWVRMLPPTAVVCVGDDCDFNSDGLTDVRDLVLMVRCVRHEGPCPPDLLERHDCYEDMVFDIADVICCATQMLRGPGCPDCPVDTVRVEPQVGVAFLAPIPRSDGVDVHLNLLGGSLVGAARLQLRYPADRYRVTGVTSLASLDLHEIDGNKVSVGLIGPFAVIDPLPGQPVPGNVIVHLDLLPGRGPGGEIRVVGGEFSGPDGVLLEVPLGTPNLDLGGPPPIALSMARPNPFSGESRFTVSLAGAAELEVGIFDLNGRRVATLFRGQVPAGDHAFTWDGRTEAGARAREGVYFYRASAAGEAKSGKLILLDAR